jgi:hypothetical protein
MVAGISPLGFRSRKFQENVTIISVWTSIQSNPFRNIRRTYVSYLHSWKTSVTLGSHASWRLFIVGKTVFPFIRRNITSVMVKVKLSLWLTKYHAIKTYPLLNKAPHIKDVRRSVLWATRLFELDIRWIWVVNFMSPPALLPGKCPNYPMYRKLGGPQNWSERGGEENRLFFDPARNRTPVTILMNYFNILSKSLVPEKFSNIYIYI